MHQLARLAFSRNEIKPAPGGHAVFSDPQNVRSDRIAMVMVVEKPAIDFVGAHLGLNGSDVRHRSPLGFKSCYSPSSSIISPRVTPEIEMRFVRLFSPATILTAAIGTFKQSASTLRSLSFARFSNAGAVSRTFRASPYAPSIAFLLPRGITRTAKITPPSRSTISITP